MVWASNTTPILVLSLYLAYFLLWEVFSLSLRQINGSAASVSPIITMKFETLCLVIIFNFIDMMINYSI